MVGSSKVNVAFVPVRGGSKSIPKKNIKEFCGRPLVYWCLAAIQKSKSIDVVYVSTDDFSIKKVVESFKFSKVRLINRSQESASDSASTELALMEFLSEVNFSNRDAIALIQATSPLITADDIDGAFSRYYECRFDSLLTCVKIKRFFWSRDGNSLNYDINKRPRRQNFDGSLMENGACYISSVQNIRNSCNRLSGKIGVYEMPDYTAVELDEDIDWIIAENYMNEYVLGETEDSAISIVLSDVDGTLTDGGMYYSNQGDELKRFHTYDGKGFEMLTTAGFRTGMITGEDTFIVNARAKKLGLNYLYQGCSAMDKVVVAEEICVKEGKTLKNVAYIGDDVNCLELLKRVGLAACPSSAHKEVLSLPRILQLKSSGGHGAFREFAEYILSTRGLHNDS